MKRRTNLLARLIILLVIPFHTEGVDFQDIKPILDERCIMCHSGETAPLGLQLDSLESLLRGSKNGAVVKSGDPDNSELIRRLEGTSKPRMPMTGPPYLPDESIALFEEWIAEDMPAGETRTADTSVPPAAQKTDGTVEKQATVTYLDVAPVFARRCAKCHTDQGLMGSAPEGYRLTSYDTTLAASDRARIIPGDPEASELVRRIRGQARPRMPFDGPPYLGEDDIRLIEEWILTGARNAEGQPAGVPVGARIRLHGTLTDRWQLDGLTLHVDERTRMDKSPSPGDYVRVRGQVGANGEITVERIKSQ